MCMRAVLYTTCGASHIRDAQLFLERILLHWLNSVYCNCCTPYVLQMLCFACGVHQKNWDSFSKRDAAIVSTACKPQKEGTVHVWCGFCVSTDVLERCCSLCLSYSTVNHATVLDLLLFFPEAMNTHCDTYDEEFECFENLTNSSTRVFWSNC